MKKYLLLIIVVAVSTAFTVANQQDDFKPLQALAGTWTMKTARGITAERWRKVSDMELAGYGFRVRGTDTTIIEYFKIVRKSSGIFYQAMVTNQNDGQTVEFKLTSTRNGTYIFSNPQHDFPSRVVYQLPVADSLHAWVEGKIDGNVKRIDFNYKRLQ